MNTRIFILVISVTCFLGCNKLVDVGPSKTSIADADVYNNDATAISVLSGLIGSTQPIGLADASPVTVSLYGGLLSDELTSTNRDANVELYYLNAVSANSDSPFWNNIYNLIYTSNAAVEGLGASTTLTPDVRKQLLGEAKFLRGFYYFHLVNLYGEVPLVLGTDYKANALLAKSSQQAVYNQIVKDLNDAQDLLSDKFLDATLLYSSSERVRPSKWAATALLARTYLYLNNYPAAEAESSKLINNSLFSLNTLSNVFLNAGSGNGEPIWQIQTVNLSFNDADAYYYIPQSPGDVRNVYLSSNLINTFEPGDQRKTNWIGTQVLNGVTQYYAYKYKNNMPGPVTEFQTVFRLAEQYLIRAEAEANGAGNGISGAVNDLNLIRHRAGLPDYNGPVTKADLITAILKERRVELFTEWGHRWFDLKRSGTVDAVMSIVTPQKGGTWASYKALLPIPLTEIKLDPNLTQNPGY